MIHQVIKGTKVPALGFGTFRMAGEECRVGVEEALAIGYRHIDTAQGYDNEEFVGMALKAAGVPREEIFLVTKVKPRNYRHADAISSTEESLRKLDAGYIDLLLMHWPNDEVPVEETLRALSTFLDDGRVRHLGVSNFPSKLAAEANRHAPIFANQVEYHPYLSQRTLLNQAREFDYLLTAYSPVAKGKIIDDPVLAEIGEKYSKSAAQVALRWLIQQERVAAIPKASSRKHREANFDIFDFELTDQEMDRIFDLARGERITAASGGPDWDPE